MKQKRIGSGHAANMAEAPKEPHTNLTPISSPRQLRALAMLVDFPEGVRSYELRKIARVMNISDIVCKLRGKGFDIQCSMESYVDSDGQETKIGRYFLNPVQFRNASKIFKGVF